MSKMLPSIDNRPTRTLRRGKHRLLLWPGREADGSVESTTPSKTGVRDEMGRLEKVQLYFPTQISVTNLKLIIVA